jgi:hypothetical protein
MRASSRSALAALMLAHAALVLNAAEVTFVLPIENGRVPENLHRIRVHQNDVVTLKWSSDRPIKIHLHGYDVEKEVKPGAVTEMTFTARATGRFAIESHASSGAHGPPLVTLEVYP